MTSWITWVVNSWGSWLSLNKVCCSNKSRNSPTSSHRWSEKDPSRRRKRDPPPVKQIRWPNQRLNNRRETYHISRKLWPLLSLKRRRSQPWRSSILFNNRREVVHREVPIAEARANLNLSSKKHLHNHPWNQSNTVAQQQEGIPRTTKLHAWSHHPNHLYSPP